MTTYALIHGGCHGGWCWEQLVPELQARGHESVAPDLPIEDVNAGAREWADVVVDALDGVDDDVVVVGHSMGGMAVPVVAARRPVRRMVFLGAMVPVPGRVYAEYLAENPDAVTMPVDRNATDELGRSVVPWDNALAAFYHDCPEPLARAAWERLRPQAPTVFTERCPIDEWPDVPSSYILMTEDRSVGNEWSRRVSRERLHTEAIELPGSHSPFMSRPGVLADVLVAL